MDVLSFAVGVGLASVIPVLILWIQARSVPMYAGPAEWTLGLALVAGSRLVTLLRSDEPWDGPASLVTLLLMAGGILLILEGLLRFDGRRGPRRVYLALWLTVLVLGIEGTLVEDSLAWYQVLASLIWLMGGVGAVVVLWAPARRPHAIAARVVMGALGGLALFHLVRLPFVVAGALPVEDPYATSWWTFATQALTMVALLLVAFGLVLMTGQRLADDLARSRDALAEANRTLEERVAQRTAQLEAANEELSALGASISHDLKAPLRAINGFAAMLLRDDRAQLDARAQGRLDAIVTSSARMARLIEELLEHARLGGRPVRRTPIPLQPLVGRVVAEAVARTDAPAGAVTLRVAPVDVMGDPELLERILRSLVENALVFHAPDDPPRVTVTAAVGDPVRIEVADEGIGIAAVHLDRIFEVFTTLNPADRYPGTGMGLAFARKAARLMGTDIGVASMPGSGSRFWVELPAAPASSTG